MSMLMMLMMMKSVTDEKVMKKFTHFTLNR